MPTSRLAHLDDATLLRDLAALVATDRSTTAALLAHIAEVDARRLYLPAAYSSMFAYCVGELGFSENAALLRIRAARTAREFPRLFEDVATGRLHLAAVCVLAPHLTAANVDELVAAATHRRKAEVEALIGTRFAPVFAPVQPARVIAVGPPPAQARREAPAPAPEVAHLLVPERVTAPLPARYVVQVPIDEPTHAKLREAQRLLAHAVPSGDLAAVLGRALDALLAKLAKRQRAAAAKPRHAGPARPRSGRRARTIPAPVRRAVWARDEGQCTFTSPDGRRCASRRLLEFDHVTAFARGGEATVEGLRLRCRAHNQFEAERTFGRDFMRRKREAAAARPRTERPSHDPEVESALRNLGCRADEARRGAAHVVAVGAAPIEERLRVALRHLGQGSRVGRVVAATSRVHDAPHRELRMAAGPPP